MNHWDFLESKLGRDVVRYVIQPMLMPSQEEHRKHMIPVLNNVCLRPGKPTYGFFGDRTVYTKEMLLEKMLRHQWMRNADAYLKRSSFFYRHYPISTTVIELLYRSGECRFSDMVKTFEKYHQEGKEIVKWNTQRKVAALKEKYRI